MRSFVVQIRDMQHVAEGQALLCRLARLYTQQLARQAEGGGGEASAVGAVEAGHALTGGSENDALIFGDEDAAGDADSARDGTGDAGARSVDDTEESLENLD
ncbi:hypothetical protein KFE25_011557 [Diacronema lutheri]|uniref:Uncharacterized protein n=1 Tax=Diacronema lutheri TaxID=2081491 RepID=A0A8J5XIY3_DIALT|nr:hypothetical protein KFE25_011556 [Diacronema lutheri]KAG8462107.1 hypothetical protein KFE25_011557 [Diacronema lutheri]